MTDYRVETMKFHALAEPSRVEAMEVATLEKLLFHAGSRKLGYVSANERT